MHFFGCPSSFILVYLRICIMLNMLSRQAPAISPIHTSFLDPSEILVAGSVQVQTNIYSFNFFFKSSSSPHHPACA